MRAVDTALDVTSSGSPVHCSVLDEPVPQGLVTGQNTANPFRWGGEAVLLVDHFVYVNSG